MHQRRPRAAKRDAFLSCYFLSRDYLSLRAPPSAGPAHGRASSQESQTAGVLEAIGRSLLRHGVRCQGQSIRNSIASASLFGGRDFVEQFGFRGGRRFVFLAELLK